jgi:hypothetical protein
MSTGQPENEPDNQTLKRVLLWIVLLLLVFAAPLVAVLLFLSMNTVTK